ncbi:hypothetical protein SLH46_11175 [Draconibacterium sp. IB214405]|uniref:hypothetical protein n=1 Tax=Draconibacterium sp. IB214405 TaxID=3097352 RepID=UPI002A0E3295|nr:hypothetical protein [Draconibacterium sp. IB214405]MDX8339748.1 hypothetical protein [Draconibacterium sp. IB214405]
MNKIEIDKLRKFNESLWGFFFLQQKTMQLSFEISDESLYHNHFVLMITDHHCMECILFALEHLKEMNSEEYSTILILYDFNNERKLNIVKNTIQQLEIEYDIELFYYKFKETFLDLSVPYYATIGEDLCLRNIFIPEKQKPELTNDYITHSKMNFSSRFFFEK